MTAENLPTARIVHVGMGAQNVPLRSPELERERHKAISDLLYENSFQLAQAPHASGPYHLKLMLEEDRLGMAVECIASGHAQDISIGLTQLKKLLHDYAIICESFDKMAKTGDFHRLEAIDMGRRGIHDEGAELLLETLENKVILDKLTARRLFSLLYVLHMRNAPTL